MAQRSTQNDGEIVSNDVVRIASGWWHSSFFKSDHRLWRWEAVSAASWVTAQRTAPTTRTNFSGSVTALAGGSGHSLLLNPMAAFGRVG